MAAGTLWEQSVSGGQAKKLIDEVAYQLEPSFSPDGKQLAFVSDKHGIRELRGLISPRDRRELLGPLVARLGFCSRAGAAMARALCFSVPTPLARRIDASKWMLRPAIPRNWHKAAAIGQADLNCQRMG
jgi:hypothetical protein